MLEHMNKLLRIPGSKLLFGGEALENHSIPTIYGAIKPTAVFVPIEEILKDDNYELVTREIFGPFQVIIIRLEPYFSIILLSSQNNCFIGLFFFTLFLFK